MQQRLCERDMSPFLESKQSNTLPSFQPSRRHSESIVCTCTSHFPNSLTNVAVFQRRLDGKADTMDKGRDRQCLTVETEG
jgi:hypothetical protein